VDVSDPRGTPLHPQDGTGDHERQHPHRLDLHLVLEAGDRLTGTIGRLQGPPARRFNGWLDLMGAISALRDQTDTDAAAT